MGKSIYLATQEDIEQIINNAVGKAFEKVRDCSDNKSFEVMNIEQVSEFLQLSISTIYDKTSKKLIPHTKQGRKLFFIRKHIEQWVIDGVVKSSEEIEQEAMDYVIKKKTK